VFPRGSAGIGRGLTTDIIWASARKRERSLVQIRTVHSATFSEQWPNGRSFKEQDICPLRSIGRNGLEADMQRGSGLAPASTLSCVARGPYPTLEDSIAKGSFATFSTSSTVSSRPISLTQVWCSSHGSRLRHAARRWSTQTLTKDRPRVDLLRFRTSLGALNTALFTTGRRLMFMLFAVAVALLPMFLLNERAPLPVGLRLSVTVVE